MAINLISPSTSTTAVLIADTYTAPGGSSDAIPVMTQVSGVTVPAALEIQSTLGALLLPRMDSIHMNALTPPTDGMLIFNTDVRAMFQYSAGSWRQVAAGSGSGNVTGEPPSVRNNIVLFDNTSATLIKDSGAFLVSTSLSALSGQTGLAADPTGIELGNVTYIQFAESNLSGFIFLGTKACMSIYDEGGTNLNTVFTGTTTAAPSSLSCLVELQSTTGALCISRMTVTQRNALISPQPGMMIFNTSTTPGQFNFYDGTQWIVISSGGSLPPVTANYQLLSSSTGTPAWTSQYYDSGNPKFNLFIATNITNPVITGTHNLGIGFSSAMSLTTGIQNTAVGFEALEDEGSGSRNSAFGFQALISQEGANDNSAFGYIAGFNLSSGGQNTCYGSLALTAETTGGTNSAFGYSALLSVVGGNGNSAFGNLAGSQQPAYTRCTFIGSQADASANGLTNATAIGANASVGQSNSLILGSGVNVGIGTSTPNTSAILDLTSTTGALLLPRLSDTQRNALTAAAGMTIFDTSSANMQYYNGSAWVSVTGGGGGSFTWVDQTSTTVTMAINTGYVADNAALVTLTLPATAAFGSIFIIQGKGAGGWTIAQQSGQQIHLGNTATTAGTGGSLSSTNQWDSVTLVCVTANTTFAAYGSIGNITVV